MNPIFILVVVSLLFNLGDGERKASFPADADARYTVARATEHVSFLASDEMKGRDTPSEGLDKAAEYIADHFKKLGLEPLSSDGYKIPYNLVTRDLDTARANTYLTLHINGVVTDLPIKKEFVPFEQTGEGQVREARVVFAGFGITAPEYDYDDYASIDAKGAVVVVFRGEPEHEDETKFNGKKWTRYSFADHKKSNAEEHGALAVLILDAPRSKRSLMLNEHGWRSLTGSRRSGGLQLDEKRGDIPVIHVGDAVAAAVFGSIDTLVSTITDIDKTLQPSSREMRCSDMLSVSCKVTLTKDIVPAANVAAILRGAKYPDEYVVMGAHYDHVGVGKANAEGDSIFNGADDNGSGTTGILLVSEALATSTTRPDRSIVFVAFSAEEKGLLGSKAYVANSPLPIKNCVAMINMDMIGRCENSKLSIGGNLRCPGLVKINEEENTAAVRPFTLAYDIEQYFFRSDQASFAMKKIPVLFYFTGEHKDYHKQTDEVSKLNMADLVAITRLASRVAWRAAHQPRTTYVPAGIEE
ncbi:MAG: M20/M25/M40 family metallo-hydrolase [Ignavibacteria bacterium]|nr:M20/M25/M40 family metallo-hydrolase [Ignavibacteria bacterium]